MEDRAPPGSRMQNPQALHIATGWARKRYGPKLSTTTLHTTPSAPTPMSIPGAPSPPIPPQTSVSPSIHPRPPGQPPTGDNIVNRGKPRTPSGPSPTSPPELGSSPPPVPIYAQVVIQAPNSKCPPPVTEGPPVPVTHPHVRPRALSPSPTCPLSASTPLPQRSKTRLSFQITRDIQEPLPNSPTPQLSPVLPILHNKPSIPSPSSSPILPQQPTEEHPPAFSHQPTHGTLLSTQSATQETGD
ncbi:uncharacterized protein LOC126384225 [Epinephelus moara]|uniref:uncharacterized protein LOC126384225 n=1 Tax=Epinephelus moara TaxID=300413 RepID=UPI00214F3EE2|nr:uncharacterized protein LOC126384225 [Epinephelus moara]